MSSTAFGTSDQPNPNLPPPTTYTFPEPRSPPVELRGHLRSISHGGSATAHSAPGPLPRPSALKGSRGHQRALSQGQIAAAAPAPPSAPAGGHARAPSKTDFILPPGHKAHAAPAGGAKPKGHSRQASRSESIYTLRRTAPPQLWERCVGFLLRRKTRPEPEERYRTVVPNHIVPPKTPRKEHPNGKRPNNRIRTTKYTLLSFLPRNLLEQFHRFANLYFILIVLLNWFPAINAFGKEIAMIPVLFVLGVTAVKDLFEDRRRHASDKRINNSTCRIYQSEAARYKKVLWKEVRVGDLIHLSNNEVVPADILLLRSSDPSGLCYIDTGHLDGETNLKQRQVAGGFVDKQRAFEPNKFRSILEVESPTTKIYRFHGAIIHPSGERVPIGTDNLLLRECLLKNTDFVEGIVVYAGHETKAMLNNGGPRYKRSTLERQMNRDVLWCVVLLVLLCTVGAIGCKIWLALFFRMDEPFKTENDESTEAFLAFWTYIILLQIMIPLSLYVTLELCKIIQVYHIHHNLDLYDPILDTRTECRALNITEELGQIQYIFSDKTGTLTENRMIFRRCAIAGIDYNHPQMANDSKTDNHNALSVVANPRLNADLRQLGDVTETLYTTRPIHSAKLQEFLLLLALCNTVVCSRHPHVDLMNDSGLIDESFEPAGDQSDKYKRLEESRSVTPSPPLDNECSFNVPVDSATSLKPQRPRLLHLPLIGRKSPGASCSTLKDGKTPSTASPHELKPIFEAESPDELALVDAAYNYNFKLFKRTLTSATIDVFDRGQVTYEILNVLPFDSNRKRMSVIVKQPNGEIILYCKGADSSILPYLTEMEEGCEHRMLVEKTQAQLNDYAKDGLRVLCMAKRTLTLEEYETWWAGHVEVNKSLESIEKRTQESYSAIESNLLLLGATGIEDRLQEGVPETLYALMSAGIVIWVLTGDKPETAINIAYSAKLFLPQMEILKLMTRSRETAENTINFYLNEIEKDVQLTSSRQEPIKERALVVDGKTLTFILDRRANLTKTFLNLTKKCRSVLCCRATPLQKAYIVKVVKEELKMRTLAIGDGANDVSMIQTADVGIGISGQEGMQAVMAADFAMSRFKFLERLLLVHGHWSYDRLSRMVLYFFYKNAAFVFLAFWYQWFCGFSGAVMIDQMYLMLYNLLFTSLPPIAIGVYDQDAPEELLLEKPYLYRQGREGRVYRTYSFWLTMLDAVYQSLCIFFICHSAYQDTDIDMFEFGTTATTAGMFVMLVHVAIEIRSWTVLQMASIVLSIGAFYAYSFVYNSLCVDCFGLPSTFWIIHKATSRSTYWFVTLLSCVAAILPRLVIRVVKTFLVPDDVTRAILSQRRASRRGEGFLVSWSRSTSTSSIYRTADNRPKNNAITPLG